MEQLPTHKDKYIKLHPPSHPSYISHHEKGDRRMHEILDWRIECDPMEDNPIRNHSVE